VAAADPCRGRTRRRRSLRPGRQDASGRSLPVLRPQSGQRLVPWDQGDGPAVDLCAAAPDLGAPSASEASKSAPRSGLSSRVSATSARALGSSCTASSMTFCVLVFVVPFSVGCGRPSGTCRPMMLHRCHCCGGTAEGVASPPDPCPASWSSKAEGPVFTSPPTKVTEGKNARSDPWPFRPQPHSSPLHLPRRPDPGRSPQVGGLRRVLVGRASARRGPAGKSEPYGRAKARPKSELSRVLRDLRQTAPFSSSANPKTFGMGLGHSSRLGYSASKAWAGRGTPQRQRPTGADAVG
jgi:hypothetical protein